VIDKVNVASPVKDYSAIQGKESQTSCVICFEEYKEDTKVRQISCSHVYHSACIMEWIQKKPEQPDCPQCRQPLVF
jgi:hypothetical protein